jgi:HD-like signal output (HDOD) protein
MNEPMSLAGRCIDVVNDLRQQGGGWAPFPTLEDLCIHVEKLSPFPPAADRILRVVNDDRSTATDLEKVVSLDPTMALRVLQMANSAFYGRAQPVITLREAITTLGFREIRDLAISISFASQGKVPNPVAKMIWEHLVSSAAALSAIASFSPKCDRDAAFMTGFLHDFGMEVMRSLIQKPYESLVERARTERLPLYLLEQEMFGYTHADVGAFALKRARIPEVISWVAQLHHDERAIKVLDLPRGCATMVWAAILAEEVVTLIGDAFDPPPAEAALAQAHKEIGLSADGMEVVVARAGHMRSAMLGDVK